MSPGKLTLNDLLKEADSTLNSVVPLARWTSQNDLRHWTQEWIRTINELRSDEYLEKLLNSMVNMNGGKSFKNTLLKKMEGTIDLEKNGQNAQLCMEYLRDHFATPRGVNFTVILEWLETNVAHKAGAKTNDFIELHKRLDRVPTSKEVGQMLQHFRGVQKQFKFSTEQFVLASWFYSHL